MQYDEFISRVQNDAKLDSREDAIERTRTFRATLGNPLSRDETHELAAQLPKERQSMLYESKPLETARSDTFKYNIEAFYNRLKGRLDINSHEAVAQAKAVARVLNKAVSGGQMNAVTKDLSQDWQALFRS